MAPSRPRGDLRIRLLGAFQVVVGERALPDAAWRLRKPKGLLKLLALADDHALHRDQLLDLLWPDLEPAAATRNLRHALHVARRTLDPTGDVAGSALVARGDLILLRPPGQLWIDAEAFEAAVGTARRTRDPADYDAAIDAYAGDLLPEDRYEDWAARRRQSLRETHLALLLELARAREERGEPAQATAALRRLIAQEPAHEEAHAGLMRLYARAGQRHQALRQFQQLQEALRRELDAVPDRATERLAADIQAGRFPPPGPPAVGLDPAGADAPSGPRSVVAASGPAPADADGTPRTNLPIPLTSFVGREREIAEIRRLLGSDGPGARLLTLTGAGGCGKTRLAIAAAHTLPAAFPDGVWLVELAPLAEPALVPSALAATVGVREEAQRPLDRGLIAALRAKMALVVLDNCEHLVAACADLARLLLNGCPRLRILATSREPLGVDGERALRVPSLGLPDRRALPPAGVDRVAALGQAEAVRLFCERATATIASFALTPDNAPAVLAICERLDGMPLAIELAAARVRLLGIEQLAARLDDRFHLLTGGSRTALPRHRTLRAAIEWSDTLLSDAERTLLRRLAVFAGGWTLEAAEAVCGDGGPDSDPTIPRLSFPILSADVLDLLGSLVDKSLVQVDEQPGAPRYRLLETVRQFAAEGLDATGETGAVRRRHASYFLGRAEQTYAALRGPGQIAWLGQLESELDNFRAAMGWALDAGETDVGLRLAAGLDRFWHHGAHLAEGRHWLDRGLGAEPGATGLARARALGLAGSLALFLEGPVAARALLNESLTLLRALGSPAGTTDVVDSLGDAAFFAGDLALARALHEENLAAHRALGDHWGAAMSLLSLGWVALGRDDASRARALLAESLALARGAQDKRGIAMALGALGLASISQGDLSGAVACLAESLTILDEQEDQMDLALHLGVLAAALGSLGPAEDAARLLGAAAAIHESLGTSSVATVWSRHTDPLLRAARARLDPAAWDAAWAAGRLLSPSQVVAAAIQLARAAAAIP